MSKILFIGLLAALPTLGAFAQEPHNDVVQAVTINSFATVGSPFGFHQAGNFEITLANGAVPASLSCDPTYITTASANDPGQLIFTMLQEARELGLKVTLRLSDSGDLQAWPLFSPGQTRPDPLPRNRCSVVAVAFLPH